MTNPDLKKCVRRHYEARCFTTELITRLAAEIDRRSGDAGVEIAKDWWVSFESLAEVFVPIEQSTRPAVLHPKPAAILSFSFGYRLDSPLARFPEDRKPGPNNVSLAVMTEDSRRIFPEAWLAVQHEVAVALGERGAVSPEKATPARDWNTAQVLAFFVEHLPSRGLSSNRSVVVVSHLHHYGRVALLLARAGLEASPPPKEVTPYAGYDAAEAQPRFRSPWEYLVNDFLAICRTAAHSRTFSEKKQGHLP